MPPTPSKYLTLLPSLWRLLARCPTLSRIEMQFICYQCWRRPELHYSLSFHKLLACLRSWIHFYAFFIFSSISAVWIVVHSFSFTRNSFYSSFHLMSIRWSSSSITLHFYQPCLFNLHLINHLQRCLTNLQSFHHEFHFRPCYWVNVYCSHCFKFHPTHHHLNFHFFIHLLEHPHQQKFG